MDNLRVHRPVSGAGIEACMAFGAASLSVMEAERATRAGSCGRDGGALDELLLTHDRLRVLFATGGDGVPELALSVMVLAERILSSPV